MEAQTTDGLQLGAYRVWWLLYWCSIVATLSLAVGQSALAPLVFLLAFLCAVVTVFWQCPACGKRVGFKSWGPILAGLPGARRCVHCRTLLVRFVA